MNAKQVKKSDFLIGKTIRYIHVGCGMAVIQVVTGEFLYLELITDSDSEPWISDTVNYPATSYTEITTNLGIMTKEQMDAQIKQQQYLYQQEQERKARELYELLKQRFEGKPL